MHQELREQHRPKRFLGIRQLRERYGGRSHMFVERLIKNDPSFPRPIKIAPGTMSHRMWDEDALEAWERAKATGAA